MEEQLNVIFEIPRLWVSGNQTRHLPWLLIKSLRHCVRVPE